MNRRTQTREQAAAEHRGKGIVKQIKGNVKEAWGRLTDNSKAKIEGKAGRAAGRVQERLGDAIDPKPRRR
ncbi:MAG TPA: CsbD family protein [Thermoanaerobaculia bacterium]|nr:CsbD family protein [Thermoanaerobaculia bacterium]